MLALALSACAETESAKPRPNYRDFAGFKAVLPAKAEYLSSESKGGHPSTYVQDIAKEFGLSDLSGTKASPGEFELRVIHLSHLDSRANLIKVKNKQLIHEEHVKHGSSIAHALTYSAEEFLNKLDEIGIATLLARPGGRFPTCRSDSMRVNAITIVEFLDSDGYKTHIHNYCISKESKELSDLNHLIRTAGKMPLK